MDTRDHWGSELQTLLNIVEASLDDEEKDNLTHLMS